MPNKYQLIEDMKRADRIATKARTGSYARKAAIDLRNKAFAQFVWGY